ncbi:MAG: dUTP diphosphatase [Bacteroidetes bacterium]|nr:dUTP diphosphatase [Bacteroidota bacterium]
MDLSSSSRDKIFISPGDHSLIPTNIILEIPEGYEGQIRPRSGLALKHGITVLNSPGTIDSDYRGEIKVLLINHGKDIFEINAGDRIAQLVISDYSRCELSLSESISDSVRGEGGYGSTGKKHDE